MAKGAPGGSQQDLADAHVGQILPFSHSLLPQLLPISPSAKQGAHLWVCTLPTPPLHPNQG